MPNSPLPTDNSRGTSSTGDRESGHVTVLLAEAVEALRLTAGATYVDATFGGGGHSRRILEHQPPIGRLIALDADLAAGARAEDLRRDVPDGHRLELFHANFRHLDQVLRGAGAEHVAGVLFDLGVSSYQFDEGERGFSFRFDSPLDMRFDQSAGPTAADIVNGWDEADIASMLWTLGEERQSRSIAAAIHRHRSQAPIETTGELAAIIERAVGGRRGKPLHPATRSFQALRIAVNGELAALEAALAAIPAHLAPGGRLVVISFHSLEDRIVKRFIEQESRSCVCPPEQPVCTCTTIPTLRRVGKPVRPLAVETSFNPRSRSAIMRVAERLGPSGNPVTLQGRSA